MATSGSDSCNQTDTVVSTPAGVFEEVFSGQSCEFPETLSTFWIFFWSFSLTKMWYNSQKNWNLYQHIYQQAKQPKYVTKH